MEPSQIQLHAPNENVFNEYGNPWDEASAIGKAEFLFIRHGESCFNELSKKLKAELTSMNLEPEEFSQREREAYSDFKKYKFLIDAKLNEKGENKQCKN